jgi:uncharacterized protein involved in exopolysaccharide biosynthesis
MSSQGVFTARPPPRYLEARDVGDWAPRVRYPLSDYPVLLWRERWLMLGVFLVIAILGVCAALAVKTVYPAHSSVLVNLSPEYVYIPSAGDAARGAIPDSDHILDSEAEILGSDAVRMRVVRRLGVDKLAPRQAAAYAAASPEQRDLTVAKLAAGMGHNLKIDTAPANPVIRLTYEDKDPARAALVLNTLLEEYLVYRRDVLTPPTAAALEDQRRAFEQRLADADTAYQAFLTTNQIGDFEAEKASLSQLAGQIEQQQYATDATLREKSGRMAAIEQELTTIPSEVTLYHDADQTAPTQLATLKVQREGLLARYKPDAQPVKDLDAQIARLEAGIAAGRTSQRGTERTGLSPVYQTFQTERLQLAAEVAALKDTAATLADQMNQLTVRRLRLAQIEPQYEALNRDRDVLSADVKDFTTKAQESEAAQAITAATNDDIRIVERAQPPAEGKSLRKPVMALALAAGLFSAICAGLLRSFLRPGLPTPASAGRTLDLPVLGAAALKQSA